MVGKGEQQMFKTSGNETEMAWGGGHGSHLSKVPIFALFCPRIRQNAIFRSKNLKFCTTHDSPAHDLAPTLK